jgi:leader peptidase (prepilin peptidase)/N-methyltransferase
MAIVVFFGGMVMGCFLVKIIKNLSSLVANKENAETYINVIDLKKPKKCTEFTTRNIIVILISGLLFLISFLQFALNIIFIQALVLNSILIVVSFVDIEHQIIPNKIIICTLLIGIVCLFISDISFINALGGMVLGGGFLLLLALIPGVLGGGDIKLMFALGMFLGIKGVWVAIFLSFAIASIISILLLLLKVKKRKDYIPFGPFLSIGTFIAFHFFNIF